MNSKKAKGKTPKRNYFWSIFKWVQILLWGTVAFLVLLFFGISKGLLGKMPSPEQIQQPESMLATELYAKDYQLIGTYYIENRMEVPFDELSPHLVNALVATEDKRFENHAGIDFPGFFRVIIKTFVLRQPSGGGSTISQQTAKNLFHNADYSSKWARGKQKLKEWVLAVQLERNFTKEEIVALYFNTVSFNYNAVGIKSAARTYFSKLPSELNPEEAAVLVGMLKGPTIYNPRTRVEAATGRRNVVLMLMTEQGFLTESQKDSLQALPLELDYITNDQRFGPAPYFMDMVKKELLDWIDKNPKPDGSKYNIYEDGLKVYTTLDMTMQEYANEAVSAHMTQLQKDFFREWDDKEPWKYGTRANPDLITTIVQNSSRFQQMVKSGMSTEEAWAKFKEPVGMTIFDWGTDPDTTLSPLDSIKYYQQILQPGFMAVDPRTGHILAMVGGADFEYFQLNHTQTKRQVGSTMKPVLYATAVEVVKMEPCFKVPYVEPNIPGNESWDPKGTGKWEYGELVPIQEGLAQSDNRITAQVMKEVKPGNMITMAEKMGIEADFDPGPAIALGTTDISLTDMLQAYSAFANNGVTSDPICILRIEDEYGNVLDEFKAEHRQVLEPKTAFIMNEMLKKVVNEGTAQRLRWKYGFNGNIAGKTGTTQSNSDGWFIGFTPQLLAGVWVGADQPSVSFASTALGQGANAALPIWALFYQKVYTDPTLGYQPDAEFFKPDGWQRISFNCDEEAENPYLDLMPF